MKKLNKTLLLASTLFVSSAVSVAEKSYADEGYDLNVEPSKSTNLDNSETQTNNDQEANLDTADASHEESSSISAEENQEVETYNSNNTIEQTPSLTPQEDTKDLEEQELEEENQEANLPVEENKTNTKLEDTETELENTEKEDSEENEASNQSEKDQEGEVDKENKEDLSKENINNVVYYNDKNLDEIFNFDNKVAESKAKLEKDLDDKKETTYNKDSQVEKSKDSKEEKDSKSEETEEETNLEERNYYAQKGTGYLVNEKGNIRYYENNKLVKNARILADNKIYDIDSKGVATNPKAMWSSINKNIYYSDENGEISKGIKEIKGSKYYFNAKGHLQRNKIIVTNKAYYNIANDGVMTSPTNKWATINNKKYYNDNNGKLLKGGIAKIGDKSYYFNNKGVLSPNKKLLANDKYYLVDRNGIATNRKNAWFSMRGKTYRSDENGKLVKGAKTINNNTYVFESNGVMIQNRPAISAGKYYKIDNRGVASVVKNSWVELDGKKYHTNANGYVKSGVWKIDNEYYYFTQNGLTPNKTITQKGVVYTVDERGIAKKEDNNIQGTKNLDKTIEWMFNARDRGMTYNMGSGRYSSSQADCSSAVYRSLIYGGFLSKDAWVGNTETLFQLGAKGKVMYEIQEHEIQYGDIFVSGRPGASAGAAGHTGFILNNKEDTIIHMTYSKNGVAVTPRKGYMGDYRGLPVRYYRLVGANSSGAYINRK